ncbi:MAG TPA: class I SAM-dependent methyltransferase [Solirubrobacterales bacterium]
MAINQVEIDRRNAAFWDELCGTGLATQLGITEPSRENLARFDAAYLALYPYLGSYLPAGGRGERLLEIGLGYGTVSQALAQRGFNYSGLDIAPGPVEMVRHRLAELGIENPERRVRVGSALEIDHPQGSFDHVVTIGCLHHTGDLPRAVEEVRRVLRPGGRALVMVYNARSFRRLRIGLGGRLRGRATDEEEMRGRYDRNLEGEVAPATAYISKPEARQLFSSFSEVRVRRENFDPLLIGPVVVGRERLLGWPAHLAGLDLYVSAVK